MACGMKGHGHIAKQKLLTVGHGDDIASGRQAFGENLAAFRSAVVNSTSAAGMIAVRVGNDRRGYRCPRVDMELSEFAEKAPVIGFEQVTRHG